MPTAKIKNRTTLNKEVLSLVSSKGLTSLTEKTTDFTIGKEMERYL